MISISWRFYRDIDIVENFQSVAPLTVTVDSGQQPTCFIVTRKLLPYFNSQIIRTAGNPGSVFIKCHSPHGAAVSFCNKRKTQCYTTKMAGHLPH